jgi:hypothetical protein
MTVQLDTESLWLVPFGMAICFMFWVLLSWWREQRRRNNANDRIIRAELILSNGRHPNPERLFRLPR